MPAAKLPVTRFFLAGSRASGACTCSAPERVSFFIRCYARSFAVQVMSSPAVLVSADATGGALASLGLRSLLASYLSTHDHGDDRGNINEPELSSVFLSGAGPFDTLTGLVLGWILCRWWFSRGKRGRPECVNGSETAEPASNVHIEEVPPDGLFNWIAPTPQLSRAPSQVSSARSYAAPALPPALPSLPLPALPGFAAQTTGVPQSSARDPKVELPRGVLTPSTLRAYRASHGR